MARRAAQGMLALWSLSLIQCNWSEHSCTAMGVWDEATVSFVPSITEAGLWCFEIDSAVANCVACADLSWGQLEASDAGNNAVRVPPALANLPQCATISGLSADTIAVMFRVQGALVGISVDSYSNLQQSMPDLTYHAYLGNELRYERNVVFTYHREEPNGPGCGVVHRGAVETPP